MERIPGGLPAEFRLEQNFPNPFNLVTVIRFSIKEAASVKLCIYDGLGRIVCTLVDQKMDRGRYEVSLDATGMASGVYMYSLQAGKSMEIKKLVMLK